MPIKAVLFDAYGTLLDVHSAMAAHAARIGPDWPAISAEWRAKQLEYSWISALTGQHRDFWDITQDSLRVAAARHGCADPMLLTDVAWSYRALAAYPEVPGMLTALRARGLATAILSNGEPAMLADAVRAAGLTDLLDDVLSIESAGIFKPAPQVYALATTRFACAAADILFVSSNPWDAYGAALFGCQVAWVNRASGPVEYGLDQLAHRISDLTGLETLM